MTRKTVVSIAVEYKAINGDTDEPITDEKALAKIDDVIAEYVRSAADGGLYFGAHDNMGRKITEDFSEQLDCPEITDALDDGFLVIEEITFTRNA